MIDEKFAQMMNEIVESLKKDKKFMEFHDKMQKKKEERLKFEKALKEYGKQVLAVDFLTNNKEEGQ